MLKFKLSIGIMLSIKYKKCIFDGKYRYYCLVLMRESLRLGFKSRNLLTFIIAIHGDMSETVQLFA